ncbi:hypothetical protein PVL29_014887 [Vitis rotundifolia]|uniref:Uncharacterized protein n=1 Tax=Vitis rotundifolia TaxID=103349 RepID=A0AA38ZIT4_VITRO|nr:hypothetical protein PVL29_014887 [Vitis rotundifolia]
MGTKLQYMINVLATSPNSSRLTEKPMDDWDYFKNKELKVDFKRNCIDKLHNSMDRILEQNNVETIKKTMLMHEDVFKHQVQELHRLYSVQKMLMKELKGEKKQTRLWSPRAGLISQHHLPLHTACGDSFWVQDDPSSRELSSSCSGDTLRMARGLDLKRANQEGVSTAFNAIDEAHQHPEDNKMSLVEESDVELTLSIGTPTSRKKKPENHQPNRSLELACSELTNNEIPDLGSSSSPKPEQNPTLTIIFKLIPQVFSCINIHD